MSTTTPHSDYVVILDAGSQYGKVIDRKVRELNVETVILPLNTPVDTLKKDPNIKGIIISGSPHSIHDADAPSTDATFFDTITVPVLGICYGMQLMAGHFGGKVGKGAIREDGQDEITVSTDSPIFSGLSNVETVLLTHGDSVEECGEHLKIIGKSSSNIIAAVQHQSSPFFGVQFHPEVELSVNGKVVLKNFLNLCGCSFSFTMDDREQVAINLIKERTSNGQKVLCLASGGVDSTVCAVLLLKALGPERVVCVHIDHGFMRLGESQQVIDTLTSAGVNVKLIRAVDEFAHATTTMKKKGTTEEMVTEELIKLTDPEQKRNVIGNTFMSVCDRAIADLHLDTDSLLLAQGTLRPDLIESGSTYASKKADAIKTHHNDTAVVRQLRDAGKIIEPLCDYHKDEVRELGRRLGIPAHLVERQPFPGPGLAIRILCSDGTPFVDATFEDNQKSLKSVLAESFFKGEAEGVILPIRSVGVQGDGRTYAYASALSLGRFPTDEEWRELLLVARAIPKNAHSINRVCFMFGEKESTSPSTTETYLTQDIVDKLRLADNCVNEVLLRHGLLRVLSQVPVVLLPITFSKEKEYCVVIRTFLTSDFMTGIPACPGTPFLPSSVLEEMVDAVSQLPFVSKVLFDLTAKPPGTTEWE
ncbi:GMP synthase (glutamine-hydrolysing) [Angomonas deanei]|nr:GMP synthase [Angomonas deanei]EPY42438.1 GMP synthase [Angomonas deanei]EPY43013.1 GMP synthase (glutamine-hydrolysing) [Angomonas deanei]|eukprot:EPY37919.1 GMP synthase [Angomonas deanei]